MDFDTKYKFQFLRYSTGFLSDTAARMVAYIPASFLCTVVLGIENVIGAMVFMFLTMLFYETLLTWLDHKKKECEQELRELKRDTLSSGESPDRKGDWFDIKEEGI